MHSAKQKISLAFNAFTMFVMVVNMSALGVFFIAPAAVEAADSGFQSPTANMANGHGDDWDNPQRAYSDNSEYASEQNQEKHRYYNFNFNLPAGATINGIEVKTDAWSTDSSGCQLGVDLSWNGGASWSNEKTHSLTGSQSTYSLGGNTDKWGTHNWVATDFSNANFRARVRDIDPGQHCNGEPRLDWLRIKVNYTSVCEDKDGDGATDLSCGGTDCDDSNSAIKPGAVEACDGIDNDCSKDTPDGWSQAWWGADCDGSLDEDLCTEGVFECVAGVQTCSDKTITNIELCDGTDNDCDGETDEGYIGLGNACSVGVGACSASGVWQCSAAFNGVECSAVAGNSTTENCTDQSDNDCDGSADCADSDCAGHPDCEQGCTADGDDDGICDERDNCVSRGNADQLNSDNDDYGDRCDNCPTVANNGQEDADGDTVGDACEETECTPATTHGEVCNNIDDDCDGSIDEGLICGGGGPECVVGPVAVVNGGFEAPIVEGGWYAFDSGTAGLGWGVEWLDLAGAPATAKLELQRGVSGWSAAEGSQWAELDSDYMDSAVNENGSVTIYQDIDTISGAQYKVSFKFGSRPDSDADDNKMRIQFGSIDETVDLPVVSEGINWTAYEYTMTAADGSARLQFTDMGNPDTFGTLLDDVKVELTACAAPATGSIVGCKWNDLNANGHWEGLLEIGTEFDQLSGWEIVLKKDGEVVATDITNAEFPYQGCYEFTGLEAGTYTLSETQQPASGWEQTYPNAATAGAVLDEDSGEYAHTVVLAAGQNVTNVDFGNHLTDDEPVCVPSTTLLDPVAPDSLSSWNVTNSGGNPIFSYGEIVSPFDESTAIRTSVVGSTIMQCPSQTIDKKYALEGNTQTTDLKAYLAFTSTMDYYNFPYVVVTLLDADGVSLGYQVYYGQGVISGLYAGYAAGDPSHYNELPVAAGDVTLDLSKLGDIDFAQVMITLSNYACVGENSVTFDHLRVVEDCGQPTCGNNEIDEGESCDDGNENGTCEDEGATCGLDCRPLDCGGNEAVCGDGTVDEGEQCDDGNQADGDGCSANCANEGSNGDGDGNRTRCGNGIVESGETCDDGNTAGGDGCTSTCTQEQGPQFLSNRSYTPYTPPSNSNGSNGPVVKGEEGAPKLTLAKKADRAFAAAGDKGVVYTVTVKNEGSISAFNVIVDDELPAGLTFAGGGTSARQSIGDLAAGESEEVTFVVDIAQDAKVAVYTNTAEAKADNHDAVRATAELEVRAVKVLAATGFSGFELLLLLGFSGVAYGAARRLKRS